MSRAAFIRLVIGFSGGLLALAAWMVIAYPVLAFVVAVLVFVCSSIAAERAFRHFASPEAIRADLEERVRNPPS